MKDERIIESWNKIGISEEANGRILNHIYDELAEEKKKSMKKSQWSRNLAVFLITITVILMGGTTVVVAYNYLTSNGKLTLFKANKDSDLNTDVIFTLNDTVKVKNDEITGDIIECEKIIADQIKNDDMFSSQSPNAVEKDFESIDNAVDYIGYQGLHWPKLDKNSDRITITAISETGDPLQEIRLRSDYIWSDELSAISEAIIYTESFDGEIGTGVTSYSEWFMGVDFSTETVIENGREFLLASSTEFENGYLVKCVFWQENSVVYSFSLRYKEVDKEQVDTIVTSWMDSF